MAHRPTRRRVLQSALALCSPLALRPAQGCEFITSTLRLTHPWARASLPGATTAIVSMRFDEVRQADRLVGVDTIIASGADIGGPGACPTVDLPIPAGQETLLHEGGTHVRLLGLRYPLQLNRAYPMRLFFEQGGLVLASLSIDYDAVG